MRLSMRTCEAARMVRMMLTDGNLIVASKLLMMGGWQSKPPQWGTPPQFGLKLKLPNNAHVLHYFAVSTLLLLISTLLLPTSAASEPLLPPTVRRLSLPQKIATSLKAMCKIYF